VQATLARHAQSRLLIENHDQQLCAHTRPPGSSGDSSFGALLLELGDEYVKHKYPNSEDPIPVAPNVLLTDTNRWPSPARLAIRLAKAGCNVFAVCPRRGHPLMKTSVVQQAFPYSGVHPLASLAAAIEATNPQIIIPCDDRGVEHLHELFVLARGQGSAGARMAALVESSLGPSDSFRIVSARYDLLRIASEEGLRVPETELINKVVDLDSWQAKHEFPLVLKADGTFGGRGVRVARTREQAEQCFLEISRPFGAMRVLKRLIVNRDPFWLRPWWNKQKPAVIVQSYIRGRPANCAVVCWKGEVLAGIGVDVVSSEGATGPASVVRVVESPEMMRAAERIARRLKLTGFFGLDFMIEEGSGEIYLIEMNPRSTLLCHLQLGAGRDMIDPLFAKLSGRPMRETPAISQNDMIAYFPQACLAKSEFLPSSFLDIPEGEPDLIEDLLSPWPNRSLLFRLASKAQVLATEGLKQKSFD
jgi:glutathione synthase/RimK-type ligase-like ATP-grasp enzyme